MMSGISNIIANFDTGGVFRAAEIIKEGLINSSYLVTVTKSGACEKYILQKINTGVFADPYAPAKNICKICEFQARNAAPGSVFVRLVRTKDGGLLYEKDGFWRCLTYIENSYTLRSDFLPVDFFEAGAGIGGFHKALLSFPAGELEITIPGFHDTRARIQQYEQAVNYGNPARRAEAAALITHIGSKKSYALSLIGQIDTSGMPLRAVHNDTNLNNILFDRDTGKSICMIDLDTAMPGLIIHDFGDAARHCMLFIKQQKGVLDLSALSRLTEGFMSEVHSFITRDEKAHLFSGLWLITYELGLRFLTDYLENDIYFRIQDEKDNLRGAEKQFALLDDIDANKDALMDTIRNSAAI